MHSVLVNGTVFSLAITDGRSRRLSNRLAFHRLGCRPGTATGRRSCPTTCRASMLGLSLVLIVHAVGIIRPVECETVADEPLAEISVADSASCDGASALIL